MAQNTRPRSASLIQGLLQQRQWPSSQLFGWLLDDVLADLTGQRKPDPPPVEAISSLRDLAGEYARCVAEHPPFEDLLGPVFMEVAHRGDQQARGQFFTPPGIARLTAEMLNVEYSGPHPDGRLWQVYEPASGAGGMLLAFIQVQIERFTPESLRHWSYTAIDLDTRCAQMTAAQLLANVLIHQIPMGEVVVYQGNALAPDADWRVIVHASMEADRPPARHPARIEAVQVAAAARNVDLFGLPA